MLTRDDNVRNKRRATLPRRRYELCRLVLALDGWVPHPYVEKDAYIVVAG